MSILQFTPTQLFRDDSDSDSDCDDVTVQKSERQLRQLSILQKHDAAAYEAWRNVSHQYSLLLQQNHLNEIQIDNLTQQNQILIEMNIELKQKDAKLSHDLISVQDAFNGLLQENTRLVDQAFDYENETETLDRANDGASFKPSPIIIKLIFLSDNFCKNCAFSSGFFCQ